MDLRTQSLSAAATGPDRDTLDVEGFRPLALAVKRSVITVDPQQNFQSQDAMSVVNSCETSCTSETQYECDVTSDQSEPCILERRHTQDDNNLLGEKLLEILMRITKEIKESKLEAVATLNIFYTTGSLHSSKAPVVI